MSCRRSSRRILVVAGVVCACAAVAALLASRRLGGHAAGGNGAGYGNPVAGPGKMEPLLLRTPGTTGLLLATDNLQALITELRDGPAGRLLHTRSVGSFLSKLLNNPPEGAVTIEQGIRLGLVVGRSCEAEAGLLVWSVENDRGPAMGFVARVGHEKIQKCLVRVGRRLTPPGQSARRLAAGVGQRLHTLAPEGREGVSWGSAGEWLVVASSTAGCRELLDRAGMPAEKVPERLAEAVRATGEGRLAGFMEARHVLTAAVAADLGIADREWFAYVASPLAGGEWAERILLKGRPTNTGIVGALRSGGQRPLLASLPNSSLLAVSANIGDGVAFWRGLESISRSLGRHSDVIYLRRLAEIASQAEFEKDLASQFRGELTLSLVVPPGAAYPQSLIGAELTRGGRKKLEPAVGKIMSIGGGTVRSADYRGTRVNWLANKRLDFPMLPSPAYCFKGDRLVMSTASVHLKELIAGRGGVWLGKEDVARLSRGMLAARVSLKRTAPYAVGVARTMGGGELFPEEVRKAAPPIEDVTAPLGNLELIVDRWPGGTQAELRSPLPIGALIVAAMLANE